MAESAAAAATTDGVALAKLEGSGSDLEKLHQFDFLLRFPSQKAAERSTLMLAGLAFATRVERGRSDTEWLVHAVKRLYPVESDLIGLREKLDDIARQHKGAYTGWTAKVAEYRKD
jgi:Regulator of ribonuclease activity B